MYAHSLSHLSQQQFLSRWEAILLHIFQWLSLRSALRASASGKRWAHSSASVLPVELPPPQARWNKLCGPSSLEFFLSRWCCYLLANYGMNRYSQPRFLAFDYIWLPTLPGRCLTAVLFAGSLAGGTLRCLVAGSMPFAPTVPLIQMHTWLNGSFSGAAVLSTLREILHLQMAAWRLFGLVGGVDTQYLMNVYDSTHLNVQDVYNVTVSLHAYIFTCTPKSAWQAFDESRLPLPMTAVYAEMRAAGRKALVGSLGSHSVGATFQVPTAEMLEAFLQHIFRATSHAGTYYCIYLYNHTTLQYIIIAILACLVHSIKTQSKSDSDCNLHLLLR